MIPHRSGQTFMACFFFPYVFIVGFICTIASAGAGSYLGYASADFWYQQRDILTVTLGVAISTPEPTA